MKYMIHTYPKRAWYVNKYLVPSMLKQGINEKDIYIFNDYASRGNLQAFLDSLDWIYYNLDDEKGVWHIQDDVIISKDFKEQSESINPNLVHNTFVSELYNSSKLKLTGKQPMKNHWLSFQCIYIPNKYIGHFLDWMEDINQKKLITPDKLKYDKNKNDDYFFYKFLRRKYANDYCVNMKPNLVDHIDYLIGNSIIYGHRNAPFRSYYFEDLDLVKKLERSIKNDELSQANEENKKVREEES